MGLVRLVGTWAWIYSSRQGINSEFGRSTYTYVIAPQSSSRANLAVPLPFYQNHDLLAWTNQAAIRHRARQRLLMPSVSSSFFFEGKHGDEEKEKWRAAAETCAIHVYITPGLGIR